MKSESDLLPISGVKRAKRIIQQIMDTTADKCFIVFTGKDFLNAIL